MEDSTVWKIIDTYFQENPQSLVKHHIDSYDSFFNESIFQILKEMNPLKLEVDYDKNIQDFRSKCLMYIGGKDGKKVYFGKPVVHDSQKDVHYMYPNECRLRNMSYSTTIHYDVDIEFTRIRKENEQPIKVDDNGFALYNEIDMKETSEEGKDLKKEYTPSEYARMRENTENYIQSNVQLVKMHLPNLFLGRFPIMVQSSLCILNSLPRMMRFHMGECRNDKGGYFIIDGKEKVVVPQESFGDNMLNIYKEKNEDYLFSADLKSVSENVSKPVRHLSVKILASTSEITENNIGVFIPNAGNKPIPLFIVFRALGILTDKEIISYCTLKEEVPVIFAPYFEACVHDAAAIVTQYDAIHYISMFVKGRSISRTTRIIADYFLPHVGEMNFIEKAYYLGYIVQRLMSVAVGIEPEVDRDSYKYKRLQLIGPMMKNLFREYYKIQQKHIKDFFEHRYEFGKDTYNDLSNMIYRKYQEAFSERIVETGFRKAFKGNWGAHPHTKIVGVVQDMNILSNNGIVSHLRKTNLPMDSSVKLVGPRVLHGSQWGIVDPIDTPDGGNVGLHKHLSIMSFVTSTLSRTPMIDWLQEHIPIKLLKNTHPNHIGNLSKLFVNGYWVGCIADPHAAVHTIKLHRRQGLIPFTTSVRFDVERNTIIICCDGGRLCRPIFYCDTDGKFGFQKTEWKEIQLYFSDSKKDKSEKHVKIWEKIISGFHEKKINDYDIYKTNYYKWNELYNIPSSENINTSKALLEYLDTQETEGTYIAMHSEHIVKDSKFTHCELHPSTSYGVMCNLINYLEHNPASRNSFSCGQSKQACSLYSTNYQLRMDKTAVVLNSGQNPIVKSRYLQYINNEEHPYGENVIVAIMCYTGYNVEDAVLINESALQRGLFRTTYYTTYESHEEKEIKNDIVIKEKLFGNIADYDDVRGVKPDYDYGQLNDYGIINENTEVTDKTVLIGQTTLLDYNTNSRKDSSKVPKKGQLGIVDKSFMTEGEQGERIAKVRIREVRIPTFGDKFASRAGQKGTVGMILPEENMPFTKNGLRPDMIINPHALPSRMTIGQMIECIVGKACVMEGTAGECTAFYDKENKLGMFGEVLTKHNFHSSGDEIMYDGMTGKQLEATIFIGPTYYMRLKHMVKDKINYRATGPMTNLTRQPVHGRANDGGLRIGEMERDAVISHGLNSFLNESMMERADGYRLVVCNKTGMIAIYNETKDIMMSPAADGPIKFTGSVEKDNDIEINQITKHGRTFSIVRVPYAMKLLIQEMQAINVQMRIITDDNVSQLENMKNSKNIDLFLNKEDTTPKMIVEQIKSDLLRSKIKQTEVVDINDEIIGEPYDYKQPIPREMVGLYPDLELRGYEEDEKEMYLSFNPKERRAFNSNYDLQTRKKALRARIDIPLGIAKGNSIETPDDPPPGYLSPDELDEPYPEDDIQSQNDYITGGNVSSNVEDYQIGTKVFYIGDVKPNRIWYIKKINDDDGYVIDTEDLDLIKVDNSRKIVTSKDIRIPGIYDHIPLGKIQMKPQFEDEIDELSDMNIANIPANTNVNDPNKPMVNIIKIFNQGGTDNSVSDQNVQDVAPGASVSNETNEKIPVPSMNVSDIVEVPVVAPINFNKEFLITKEGA